MCIAKGLLVIKGGVGEVWMLSGKWDIEAQNSTLPALLVVRWQSEKVLLEILSTFEEIEKQEGNQYLCQNSLQ